MGSQTDLDQGGTFRQVDKVYMGPSVGWQSVMQAAVLNITATGTYTIARGTTLIKISANGNVTMNLPSSKASVAGPQAIPGQWVLAPVTIVDIGGFADTNTYRVVPSGSETISGLASVDLASERGSLILEPLLETGGWNLIQ
jgi:hypothetical protein